MKIHTSFVTGLLFILLLLGCSPVSEKALNNDYLRFSSENKILANGSYEINPFRVFDRNGPISQKRHDNILSNIVEILNGDKEVFEQALPHNNGTMNLKFIDDNTLSISITENSDELYYEEVKGRFKKDGFFYLDQIFSSTLGIPYIIGGRYKYQTRLGLIPTTA